MVRVIGISVLFGALLFGDLGNGGADEPARTRGQTRAAGYGWCGVELGERTCAWDKHPDDADKGTPAV
jgi:hypothetical protein